MTTARQGNWKESWEDFKKDLTYNNIKIAGCAGIPTLLFLYGWTFWLNKITHILNNSVYSHPKTYDDVIVTLALVFGIITPLWLCSTVVPMFGLWLGKVTRFFKDDKTRYILFDDVGYFIRDMPQDQRDKMKEILSNYKSKEQLRKDRKRNESLLRRIFT